MKRWLGGLLAAFTLFSLTACGGVVDLTDVPEDGTRFEDAMADLPVAEDPEDSSGQEDPPPEDEALLRQIDELPTAVATVIRLRFFEELSLKEIAASTGTNVNTVKSRLYAGLKKLRIAMEGENIL